MARAGRLAAVKVSGEAVAFLAEACDDLGDDLSYQISNAAKQVWDRTVSIVVYVGGVEADANDYTINRLTGTITFDVEDVRVVTVDGSYLPLSLAAEAKAYACSLEADMLEDNSFGDNFVTGIQGLKRIKGSIGRWFTTDTYFSDALQDDEIVVLEFFSLSTGDADLRMWAIINKLDIASVINGLIEESVEFSGRHDADRRVIATLD